MLSTLVLVVLSPRLNRRGPVEAPQPKPFVWLPLVRSPRLNRRGPVEAFENMFGQTMDVVSPRLNRRGPVEALIEDSAMVKVRIVSAP